MQVRIREYTRERLLLDISGYRRSLTIAGLLLIVASYLPFWAMGDRVVVEVSDQELRYERKFLALFPREAFTATAEELETVDVKGYHTITLVVEAFARTKEGVEQKIWLPSMEGSEKRWFVLEVNQALASADGTHRTVQNSFIGGTILGVACLVGGLMALYYIQTIQVLGDRESLTLIRKRTLLPVGSKVRIPRNKIVETSIAGLTVGSIRHGTAQATSYGLLVETTDGEQHPIGYGPMFKAPDAEHTLAIIDAWLAVEDLPAAEAEASDANAENESEAKEESAQKPKPETKPFSLKDLLVSTVVVWGIIYLFSLGAAYFQTKKTTGVPEKAVVVEHPWTHEFYPDVETTVESDQVILSLGEAEEEVLLTSDEVVVFSKAGDVLDVEVSEKNGEIVSVHLPRWGEGESVSLKRGFFRKAMVFLLGGLAVVLVLIGTMLTQGTFDMAKGSVARWSTPATILTLLLYLAAVYCGISTRVGWLFL